MCSTMVADNLIQAATNKFDTQVTLSIAEHDASHERYKFNPDKTLAKPDAVQQTTGSISMRATPGNREKQEGCSLFVLHCSRFSYW